MKKEHSSRFFQVIALLFILAILPLAIMLVQMQQDNRQHADTGVEIYAVADKASVSSGDTIHYDIDINTKQYVVDTVQINLTYPADKLQLVSIKPDPASFDTDNGSISGNGLIEVSRSVTIPVSGKKKMFTLTFTALQATGYDVLHPGAGLTVMSQKKSLSTGTIVTDQALLPQTTETTTPFSFSTIVNAILHLFGRK